MATRHTVMQNIYHTCDRCGSDQPLSDLRWQNGILVCSQYRCVDTAIIGKRDIDVTRAIQVYRHELEPDVKLTLPVERKNDQYDVLF